MFAGLAFAGFNPGAESETHVVNATSPACVSGDGNYATIAAAIAAASAGDTVFICNGTYYEEVNVNKAIEVVGESRDGVIVNSMNANAAGVNISAGDSSVENLTLQNLTFAGIYVGFVSGVEVSNVTVGDVTAALDDAWGIWAQGNGSSFAGISMGNLTSNLTDDSSDCFGVEDNGDNNTYSNLEIGNLSASDVAFALYTDGATNASFSGITAEGIEAGDEAAGICDYDSEDCTFDGVTFGNVTGAEDGYAVLTDSNARGAYHNVNAGAVAAGTDDAYGLGNWDGSGNDFENVTIGDVKGYDLVIAVGTVSGWFGGSGSDNSYYNVTVGNVNSTDYMALGVGNAGDRNSYELVTVGDVSTASNASYAGGVGSNGGNNTFDGIVVGNVWSQNLSIGMGEMEIVSTPVNTSYRGIRVGNVESALDVAAGLFFAGSEMPSVVGAEIGNVTAGGTAHGIYVNTSESVSLDGVAIENVTSTGDYAFGAYIELTSGSRFSGIDVEAVAGFEQGAALLGAYLEDAVISDFRVESVGGVGGPDEGAYGFYLADSAGVVLDDSSIGGIRANGLVAGLLLEGVQGEVTNSAIGDMACTGEDAEAVGLAVFAPIPACIVENLTFGDLEINGSGLAYGMAVFVSDGGAVLRNVTMGNVGNASLSDDSAALGIIGFWALNATLEDVSVSDVEGGAACGIVGSFANSTFENVSVGNVRASQEACGIASGIWLFGGPWGPTRMDDGGRTEQFKEGLERLVRRGDNRVNDVNPFFGASVNNSFRNVSVMNVSSNGSGEDGISFGLYELGENNSYLGVGIDNVSATASALGAGVLGLGASVSQLDVESVSGGPGEGMAIGLY
ncbi:MAG: hypothetical protein PHF51_03435, partial [Candidatus ainarchaeum sp.]|nr:hypothetical protein [Candidatus ainarchaeum sp.]